MAGDKDNNEKYAGHPGTEDPKVGDVWGYEGYGLEGQEDKYVFAVAFCIDGGPLRCSAATFDDRAPDEVRERAFVRCLTSVQRTWLLTAPGFMEGTVNVTPYAGQGSRFLSRPVVSA